MAKPKKGTRTNSGPKKCRGHKKHMFHTMPKACRITLGKLGALRKDCNAESKAQSEAAKAMKQAN